MKHSGATIENVPEVVKDKLRELSYQKEEYLPSYDRGVPEEETRKVTALRKGLFLHGVTGSGKTYTLYAIRNQIRGGGMPVENFVELLEELKDRMAENKPIKAVLDNILEKPYVFLDDVGAEKDTEWVQDRLYVIINRIYEAEKILFIATNLSLQEFTQRYSERITSRILEMCEPVEMPNIDKRLE